MAQSMHTHVHYDHEEEVGTRLLQLTDTNALHIGNWKAEVVLFMSLEQAEQLGQEILTLVQAARDSSAESLIETAERETYALVNS